MYKYKKIGTSEWLNCSKGDYEAYSKYPLSLKYKTKKVEPMEGPKLAEVKPAKGRKPKQQPDK